MSFRTSGRIYVGWFHKRFPVSRYRKPDKKFVYPPECILLHPEFIVFFQIISILILLSSSRSGRVTSTPSPPIFIDKKPFTLLGSIQQQRLRTEILYLIFSVFFMSLKGPWRLTLNISYHVVAPAGPEMKSLTHSSTLFGSDYGEIIDYKAGDFHDNHLHTGGGDAMGAGKKNITA